MTKLMIDPALQAKLTATLEFCDATGRTLGFFLTPEEHERLKKAEEEQRRQDYEWARTDVTDEELDAAWAEAEADGVYYSHEQVMDFLRRIEQAERDALK